MRLKMKKQAIKVTNEMFEESMKIFDKLPEEKPELFKAAIEYFGIEVEDDKSEQTENNPD